MYVPVLDVLFFGLRKYWVWLHAPCLKKETNPQPQKAHMHLREHQLLIDYFSKPLMAGKCTLLRINENRHPTAGTGDGKYDAHTFI